MTGINLLIGRPKKSWQVLLIFSTVALAFFVCTLIWTASRCVTFSDPPENGDGLEYDNLGYCLALGRGFSFDFEKPDWKRRYRRASQDPRFEKQMRWLRRLSKEGPTTSRPPGYPAFLSIVYRTVGVRWDVVRIIGCALVSLGLASLITWAWTRWGALAAIMAAATLMLDEAVMSHAGKIMTEPIATTLMCIWFVILVKGVERPSWLTWIAAAIVLVLLIYVRSNWTLWLLALIAISPLLFWKRIRKLVLPVKPQHVLTFLAISVLLIAPWWVRNCALTGHFTPMGTGGARGTIAAYSDAALEGFGNWENEVFIEHQRFMSREIDSSNMTLPQFEYEIGRHSMAQAKGWAMQNWHRLPELGFHRLMTNWAIYSDATVPFYIANLWLLLMGGIGIFLTRGHVRNLLLMIFFLDSTVVMVTWAHGGRYFVPLRPLVHVCCALAAISLLGWLAGIAVKFRKGRGDHRLESPVNV